MPSLQFFLFRSMMPFLKEAQARFRVQDIDTLVRFRERSERLADLLMPLPRRVTLENPKIGGMAGDWLIPQGAPDDPVILFLHGGGIFFGWSNPNRRILAYIATFSGLRAFGVDYRLPPDHCYPSAHDDCFTVYQTLVQQEKQIVLIGESSGGVLALAVLLRAKAEGLAQPALCVLISPTVDYGFKDARIWNSDDAFAHPRFIIELHKIYADDIVFQRIPFPPVVGKGANKQADAGTLAAFTETRSTIDDMLVDGETAVILWTWEGTHSGTSPSLGIPATGKRVRFVGCSVYYFREGKIVEQWEYGDVLGLLQQIGVIPAFG